MIVYFSVCKKLYQREARNTKTRILKKFSFKPGYGVLIKIVIFRIVKYVFSYRISFNK